MGDADPPNAEDDDDFEYDFDLLPSTSNPAGATTHRATKVADLEVNKMLDDVNNSRDSPEIIDEITIDSVQKKTRRKYVAKGKKTNFASRDDTTIESTKSVMAGGADPEDMEIDDDFDYNLELIQTAPETKSTSKMNAANGATTSKSNENNFDTVNSVSNQQDEVEDDLFSYHFEEAINTKKQVESKLDDEEGTTSDDEFAYNFEAIRKPDETTDNVGLLQTSTVASLGVDKLIPSLKTPASMALISNPVKEINTLDGEDRNSHSCSEDEEETDFVYEFSGFAAPETVISTAIQKPSDSSNRVISLQSTNVAASQDLPDENLHEGNLEDLEEDDEEFDYRLESSDVDVESNRVDTFTNGLDDMNVADSEDEDEFDYDIPMHKPDKQDSLTPGKDVGGNLTETSQNIADVDVDTDEDEFEYDIPLKTAANVPTRHDEQPLLFLSSDSHPKETGAESQKTIKVLARKKISLQEYNSKLDEQGEAKNRYKMIEPCTDETSEDMTSFDLQQANSRQCTVSPDALTGSESGRDNSDESSQQESRIIDTLEVHLSEISEKQSATCDPIPMKSLMIISAETDNPQEVLPSGEMDIADGSLHPANNELQSGSDQPDKNTISSSSDKTQTSVVVSPKIALESLDAPDVQEENVENDVATSHKVAVQSHVTHDDQEDRAENNKVIVKAVPSSRARCSKRGRGSRVATVAKTPPPRAKRRSVVPAKFK